MFTLRSMFLFVALASLGAAGLVYRTELWASAVVTVTLAILAFGILQTYSNPQKRRFWIPALVLGWLYLASAFVEALSMRDKLITSWLIYGAFSAEVEALVQTAFDTGDSPTDAMNWGREVICNRRDIIAVAGLPRLQAEFNCVYEIAHSLIAVVLATGGGAISSWRVTRTIKT